MRSHLFSNYILSFIILSPLFLSSFFAVMISQFGSRIALLDNPNNRSSHVVPTPRGGGIGIWFTIILFGIFITRDIYFTFIITSIGFLGLCEDRYNLSSLLRLGIQFILSLLVVLLLYGLPLSIIGLTIFLFFIIFIAGTANFYNFMDGINGIAGLTGVIGFGLLSLFSFYIVNSQDVALMSIALAASCLGFLPFNFPKARVFMGDVGSILLGFVFSSFVIKLSINISIFLCLIMFLFTFYADALVTIYSRWRKGENLLEAHRSHLYQYLSNELKLPYWKVALLYAVVQMCSGILAILAYQKGLVLQVILFFSFSIIFVVCYNLIKAMKPNPSYQ